MRIKWVLEAYIHFAETIGRIELCMQSANKENCCNVLMVKEEHIDSHAVQEYRVSHVLFAKLPISIKKKRGKKYEEPCSTRLGSLDKSHTPLW